ncbi:MAG TPA: hypothetical protein VGS98_09710 [Thermoanaerobaculia bacterium]|nr:hypothetical protein [Thermoanaerobaculia bacterium]
MRTKSRAALVRRIALVLALAMTTFALPRVAQAAIEGRWIAEFDQPDDRVQLTTKRGSGRHNSENSCSYPLSAFRGLVRPASKTPSPARFELARDAGTVVFEGQLDSDGGAGRFSFAPSSDFAREMGRTGYSLSEENLYTATLHDIGRSFLKGLEEVGYSRLPFDDLVSMRIHGATPEFIRELKSLGYDRLSADDLVSMRIHGATPEFVREMRAAGHDRLSADDLVSMRIHNVTPKFARELKELGYADVSADDLVSMRIHNVTTDFVRQIRDLGFRDVSVDDLASMRIHGVSADFARRAKARNPGVTVDELVSMRIHGRD